MFSKKEEKPRIKNNARIFKKASASAAIKTARGNLEIELEEYDGALPTLSLREQPTNEYSRPESLRINFENTKNFSEFVDLMRDILIELNHQKIEMNKF